MPKIPKDLMDAKIKAYENTHGKHIVISSQEMARLTGVKGFEYINKARLQRKATNAAKQALNDISAIMEKVPDSYLTEVVRSREFEVVASVSLKDLRRSPAAAGYYVQMLLYAIQGLKAATPDAFYQLVMQQIQPFITTLRSLKALAEASNAKTLILQFNIPTDLENHEYTLAHN